MNFDLDEAKESALKHHLKVVNNRVGVLAVVGGAVVTVCLDYYFKITMDHVARGPFITVIVLATISLLIQFINRRQSRLATIFVYFYLYFDAFYALTFVFPLPSPYLMFVMILPLMMYLELGARWSFGTFSLYALATAVRFWQLGQLETKGFGLFIIFMIIDALFLYYMVNFLKIADDERQALELVSEQSELERSRLLTLVENLNDAVIACDEHFTVLVSNPQAQNILNLHEPLNGKNIDELITLTDAKNEKFKISALLAKNPQKYINVFSTYKFYYSENDYVNLYLAVSKIQHGQDNNSGYVLLLRDITKLKSLEDERNEFISIMSHELRTPVSIVEGGISLAQLFTKQGGMDDKVEQYLQKAHVQALMLAEIVNSLSTLVHSEQGGEKFKLKELDPKTIADRLKTTYQPQIEAKGLQTVVRTDANVPLIYTNEEYTFEILQNFITNAIKYTKKGAITIAIQRHGVDHVAFSVSDSGIGMSKSDLAHIFEKFWRSEDFRTRETSGTGLGLYITKKLASSIGAKITVDSVLDKGTTFTLIAPIHMSVDQE